MNARFSSFPTRWLIAASCGLFLIASLLNGCGGGGSGPSRSATPTPTPPPSGNVPDGGTGRITAQPDWKVNAAAYQQNQKKWTFLVYMNGANNLEEFGSLNVNQMEQVGSTSNINVVVQFKRISGFDSSDGDWKNTRRYFVQKDSDTSHISSLLLSTREDADMGKWQTLREFVDWGVKNYPADHYCLVLWNHGAGWRSRAVPGRGVSYDDSTDNHIDTIEIPQAIDLGGLLGNGRKWDVLAFDASLMQQAEVAYEVRDKTQFITGSEESPPGEGYPYQYFLSDLAANPNMSGREFAMDIARKTMEGYQQDFPGKASEITQSALDASKLGDIAPAIADLGRSLYNVRLSQRDNIITAREDAENYAYPYYRDLLDFTRRLSDVPDANVQSAVSRVNSAVNAAIIANYNGGGHPRSNGLSIFLPSPSDYDSVDYSAATGFGQRYPALALSKAAPDWQNFIQNGPQ